MIFFRIFSYFLLLDKSGARIDLISHIEFESSLVLGNSQRVSIVIGQVLRACACADILSRVNKWRNRLEMQKWKRVVRKVKDKRTGQ